MIKVAVKKKLSHDYYAITEFHNHTIGYVTHIKKVGSKQIVKTFNNQKDAMDFLRSMDDKQNPQAVENPRSLAALKREATKSAKWRGHHLGQWQDSSDKRSSIADCENCDAYVQVNTRPLPNDIDIGGSAVAVGCDKATINPKGAVNPYHSKDESWKYIYEQNAARKDAKIRLGKLKDQLADLKAESVYRGRGTTSQQKQVQKQIENIEHLLRTELKENPHGFPQAHKRLIQEIKDSQYGLPEDQLTDFQASYLVPANPHIYENDNGYIKLTPLGGQADVQRRLTDTKNPKAAVNLKPKQRVSVGKTCVCKHTASEHYKEGNCARLNCYCQQFKAKNGAGFGAVNPQETYYELSVKDRPHVKAQYKTKTEAVEGVSAFQHAYPNEDVNLVKKTYNKSSGFSKFFIKTFRTKRNHGASDFKQFQKTRLNNLSQMFQGEVSGEKFNAIVSDGAPKQLSRIGDLVQMKVKTPNGITTIDFDGDSYLGMDLRKNLWVGGKGARLENVRNPTGDSLKYLGELIQIDYVTAKNHIEGGKLTRFWHPLGEVNKEYPLLYMDKDGFPIIVGGGYDVWDVGIVN